MSTIPRTCSQCGLNGHNSRTCTDTSAGAGSESPGENGIMLFGVRLNPAANGGFGGGAFRKSASLNNLSQFDQHNHESIGDAITDGYASDDVVHASARSHDRKRGVPWTEDEHKLFLLGLQNVGKGDWRGIARNYVKSRTPTQVASHAQKYFIRRSNHNRRRRRSSLFDITTDSVMGTSIAEEQVPQDSDFSTQHQPETDVICNMEQSQINGDNSIGKLTLGQRSSANIISSASSPKTICPIPIFPIPPSSKMAKLKLESSGGETLPLTLKLSTTSTTEERTGPWASAPEARTDNFNGNGSESTISVA